MKTTTLFSKDKKYRFLLKYKWSDEPDMMFISLNPAMSEGKPDRTNLRGIHFAKREGCGGVVFCNVYAFRTSDPKKIQKGQEAMNMKVIKREARKARIVVASWGNYGENIDLKKLYCFGKTKQGQPRHILYLPNNAKLIPFPAS